MTSEEGVLALIHNASVKWLTLNIHTRTSPNASRALPARVAAAAAFANTLSTFSSRVSTTASYQSPNSTKGRTTTTQVR